jgi:hypothetical protein
MLDVHPLAWEWIIKFIRLSGELVVNLCFTHLYCLIHSLSISNKKKREKCEEEMKKETWSSGGQLRTNKKSNA